MKVRVNIILIALLLISSLFTPVSFSKENVEEIDILITYAANPLLPAIKTFHNTLNQELIKSSFSSY